MTGFNLDFSKKTQGGAIKNGSYEVVVNRASEEATPGGAEYIELDLIVRNDVDQEYKNKHIFAKIWKAKKTNKYNEGTIMAVADALQLKDGTTYNSFEELLADFVLKTANVTVKSEDSEYKGKNYTNVNVTYWDKSNVKGVMSHEFKKGDEPSFGPSKNTQDRTIQDDDLPF